MLEKIAEALCIESFELFHGPETDLFLLGELKEKLITRLECSIQEVFARYR